MTVMCKTICYQCKYHKQKSDGPRSNMWYNQYCTAPQVKRIKEQDPVTGEVGYAHRNDLGRVVITEQQYPHCRDVNNVNCELFKRRRFL